MTVENRVKVVKKLIVKSEKNFEEANLLFEKGFYEAAISRAYYSMFHLAQAVLATKDIKRRKHSGVISALGEHCKPGLLPDWLTKPLNKVFEERQVADYEYETSKNKEETYEIINQAKEFVNEIKPYLNNWLKDTNPK